MATMATYRGVNPVTILASGAISRGQRVALDTNGGNSCAVSGIGVRGDYVALHDIADGATGAAVRMNTGEEIVGLAAAVTIVAGDPIYSAASGAFSNVSTSAVYVGKAREGAASGKLFGILLQTVA